MYHFFVEARQKDGEMIRITGTDVNHIGNVLRMHPGEQILISDEDRTDYLCEIAQIGRDEVLAMILETRSENHELPSKIVLFQGLPKADKMELIIQKAVELGAAQVVPVAMKRSVVKLDAKKEKTKLARWQALAESAATVSYTHLDVYKRQGERCQLSLSKE